MVFSCFYSSKLNRKNEIISLKLINILFKIFFYYLRIKEKSIIVNNFYVRTLKKINFFRVLYFLCNHMKIKIIKINNKNLQLIIQSLK